MTRSTLTPRPLGLMRLVHLTTFALATALVAACGGADDGPPAAPLPAAVAPTITAQPAAAVTVAEGSSAALSVAAESNAGALSYQWRSGTTPTVIDGATGASYTTPAASLVDDGKLFSVEVSNSAGTTICANATLLVTERSWSAPSVPRNAQEAGDPVTDTGTLAVAVDSTGATYMVFGEARPNGAIGLRISYTPSGQTVPQYTSWLGASDLPANVSEHDVKVVASDNGHVLAVWRRGLRDDIGGTIAFALLQPGGGSWSGGGFFSGADGASPAAAYVGNGVFEIVWRQLASSESTAYDIVASRLAFNSTTPNGQVLGTESIEAESANALAPQIASDGAGNVLIAFSTSADVDRTYGNTRTAAATSWTAANAQQFSGSFPMALSSMAMNAQGRAVVLMRSSLTQVYVSQYQFAGNESGWIGDAQYVANYNPNTVVESVAVFGAGNDFSIVSVHNFGRSLSQWPCNAEGCGSLQSILISSLDNAFTQLRAGRDAAGNVIVLFGQDQGNSLGVMAGAMRWHAGRNEWRPLAYAGTLGSYHLNGPLHLAVRPDGSASAIYPAAIDDQTFVRAWNFR